MSEGKKSLKSKKEISRPHRSPVPDYMFEHFDDIDVDFLRAVSVRFLIIDIDNTLAPYEVAEPDEVTRNWFYELEKAKIGAALVSNNDRQRVELFNRTLGLPAFYKCRKPSRKYLKKAMERLGADRESTLFLGDQIFTDVVAARRMGLRAAVVKPIKDKKTLFFKFKRLLERPIIRRYRKKHQKQGICDNG